jgi:hypothetical protein
MLPVGFEPAIPASECPQTHALESAATGVDNTDTKLYFIRPDVFHIKTKYTRFSSNTSSKYFIKVIDVLDGKRLYFVLLTVKLDDFSN